MFQDNTEPREVMSITESLPKHVFDSNKRNVFSMEERQFLDKLREVKVLLHLNLEGRDEFSLCGILVNFKKKINVSHKNLIKAIKMNQDSSNAKSYNGIDIKITNHVANRNSEGFSTHADGDTLQDIAKWMRAMLERKPSEELELDKDDSTSMDF